MKSQFNSTHHNLNKYSNCWGSEREGVRCAELLNPLWPNDVLEPWSTLVQVMAWHLLVPSHYLNQCWIIHNWTPRNKFRWSFNESKIILNQENASKNVVCKMKAILFKPQCVNDWDTTHATWPSSGCSASEIFCVRFCIECELHD